MPIAPTLILGLGGTGSDIIQKVHKKIQETSRGQSDRIEFVAFDTDVNDLAEVKRHSPEIFTVQTSTRSTVGEYLNINTNARDKWFPVNEMLNRKTLTEGAAQVRAISRLAFDTTLKGGSLEPLHQAIDHLFRMDKDQEDQALRVIITSSLAGGTGSGLILPIAMYLSNYLRTKYPKAKAITRGFFIQPDIFYTVIKATEEQRNLQVNAYAAIRELDAFLMKGDNTLPPQYSDLTFEFPKVAADGVDVVNAMPYDFCFLFDSHNTAGSGLDSFESYKDHAATCIYTQSLGPMSKKSNSREDNVLREVIMHDGRNRYAGAGASRLVYPWEHVRDYVAYRWTNLALSKQWLKFDHQIKEQQMAVAKQAEDGYVSKDINKAELFVAYVDNAAKLKDPFARAIRNQCLTFDQDGIAEVGQRWNEYAGALIEQVKSQAMQARDEDMIRGIRARIASLSKTKKHDKYASVYDVLVRYSAIVERNADEKSGVIAYSLFKADNKTITRDQLPHQLETYLRNKIGDSFVHPVSARYFLYNTLRVLTAEKINVDDELVKTTEYFKSFEAQTFENPQKPSEKTVQQFARRKQVLRQRISSKPQTALLGISGKFDNYLRKTDELIELTVKAKVIAEAITYVTAISESFEIFFTSLDSQLGSLKSEIDQHRRKYEGITGSATRYVLSSGEALDFMYKNMQYAGGVLSIDSELSENIYSKVRLFSRLDEGKDSSYFTDLYKDDIVGYFRKEVNKRHIDQIRFDVIDALTLEYQVNTKDYDESKAVHYVKGEIEKVKKLAAPFLEQPLGEERHPVQACAYNPDLERENDPKRKALVSEYLGDYGGEKDKDISPQEIMFYNAIYGIRASDLSKYAPERLLVTDKRPAGAYFSAYYQLVSEIRPSVSETRVITPHIDRRWHTIAALPDLDDAYQEKQIKVIHSAFFMGLSMNVIVFETGVELHSRYRYTSNNKTDQEFVVTNGTPCDQFYEILDALTINPVAVREITESVNEVTSQFLEANPGTTFAATPMAKSIDKGLVLTGLTDRVPGLRGRKLSILDVPAFYAASAPNGEFTEDQLRDLSANIVGCVISELERIQDSDDSVAEINRLIRSQYEIFKDNSGYYIEALGKPFARRIRTILQPVSSSLKEMRLLTLANEIDEFVNELRTL